MRTAAAASLPTRSRCRSRFDRVLDQSRSGGTSQRSSRRPARSGRSTSIRSIAPLRIGRCRGAGEQRGQLAEVRVVADEHRPDRVAGLAQDGLEVLRLDASPSRWSTRPAARAAATISAVCVGADLGRADDGVRDEPDPRQERPEPVRLALALRRERPGRVGPVELRRIAGMRVAEEVSSVMTG